MARSDLSRSNREDWKYGSVAALAFIALTACATPPLVATPPVAPATAATLATAQSSSPDVTPTSEDFATFWTSFREGALGDPRSLVKFTRFPFITNGETDDEPEQAHDEQSFLGIIDALLADDVGGPEPETHREYFFRNEVPPPNAVTGDQARVGNFVFLRIEGRWRLARGFLVE